MTKITVVIDPATHAIVPREPTDKMYLQFMEFATPVVDGDQDCFVWRGDFGNFKAEYAAMLAAAPPHPSAWQPIESAPRDGRKLRVRYADGTEEDGVFWQQEGRCCMLGSRAGSYPPGWTSTAIGCLPVDDPTHWMPLPEPPKEAVG